MSSCISLPNRCINFKSCSSTKITHIDIFKSNHILLQKMMTKTEFTNLVKSC